MTKRRILIQLDGDRHASVFDRIVAIDAGADEVFSYAGVELTDVQGLVHGAMFTRGPQDLSHTAIFIGGSDVDHAGLILERVAETFFGPFRCSVMLDPNGANTTAAAAVLTAASHVDLSDAAVLVAGGTGPVGTRVGLLLARQGAKVRVGSRSAERAAKVCQQIKANEPQADVEPIEIGGPESVAGHGALFDVAISAGAAGVQTLSRAHLQGHPCKVLIDLNAVPPAGIEGVGISDREKENGDVIQYGAVGVGALKMRIHKAALARLFDSNDQILDAEQIYDIGSVLQ